MTCGTEVVEREATLTSQLRQENVELHSRVEQQQLQLVQCKQDISNSQSQLIQLEQLAAQLQQNASKVQSQSEIKLLFVIIIILI